MSLQDDINKMAADHPIRLRYKMDNRMEKIDRMTQFYQSKQEIAPEKQGLMFKGFVNALLYAAAAISRYHELTLRINELSDEKHYEGDKHE